MLAVMEVTLGEGVRNSDGEVVAEHKVGEYVIVYDSDVYDVLRENNTAEEILQRDDVVVLPKKTWDLLHLMIENNYIMTERSDAEKKELSQEIQKDILA